MNEDLVMAVKQLVDAFCYEHCIDTSSSCGSMEQTQECVSVVIEKIRTAPELSSLHSWAESAASLIPSAYRRGAIVGRLDVGGAA
jgi:hypothetical protein